MRRADDHLKYEVKLYELENDQWNYYVYVSTRAGENWTQPRRVGNGAASTEDEAIKQAQKKATNDRRERERDLAQHKVVALQ